MAPSDRLLSGSQTIRDSSYSSTAPNPLQLEQAPRGLLNENSAGVTVTAGVSQLLQAGNSVKRSRPSSSNTIAIPSPSANAVATDSARRPAEPGSATSLSTRIRSSPVRVRSSLAGSSSR